MATVKPEDGIKIFVHDVYPDTIKAGQIIKAAGYTTRTILPFDFPRINETYLTPEGKIVTKQKGDKGPYGPRLILVKRKKRVLVLDFDEVQAATSDFLNPRAAAGDMQELKVVSGFPGETRWIEGVVEEREA